MSTCSHDSWGDYPGEDGPQPEPCEMVAIPGGVECPACKFHIVTFSGDDADAHMARINATTQTEA